MTRADRLPQVPFSPFPSVLQPLGSWLLAGLLVTGLGCGSSGSDPVPSTPLPSITSFAAAKSPITAGTGTTLSATFTGGSGVVDQGVGSVTSGIPVSVSPRVDTTYTLTVTHGGEAVTRQTTLLVALAPLKPAVVVQGAVLANQTGISASVSTQAGCTYSWSLTGGSITAGQGSHAITFACGATGNLTLACTVTNAAGDSASSDPLSYVLGPGPSKPVITAPANINVFQSALASVLPQQGCAYAWSISGGDFTEEGGAASIHFVASIAGTVTLTCKVTDANQVSVTSEPLTIASHDAPAQPVIVAPGFANAGQQGLKASVDNQVGCAFAWNISGGTLTAGAGSSAITFTAGSAGTLTLTCTVSRGGAALSAEAFSLQVLPSGGATWKTHLSESSLPPLQINLSAEGNRQWMFANMLRTSEAWIYQDGASAAQAQSLASQVQVDASGWPTSFPAGSHMRMPAAYETGPNTNLHGVFVLTWQGSGSVELQSSQNDGVDELTLLDDQTGGRIVRLIQTPSKSVIVFVNSSDPGNPVRNMRLWAPAFDGAGLELTASSDLRAGHVTGSLEPAPGGPEPLWHPRFLQHLAETQDYGVLRFMGWLNINAGNWDRDTLDWSDRADPSYAFAALASIDGSYNRYPVNAYRQRLGMPYEWMIDLCNATGKDLWIQVPHLASSDLIRKLADLCATRLDPKLRVWFEYSNEIWNGIGPYLPQQNKARTAAAAHFGVPFADVSFEQIAWGSGHLQGLALKTFEDEWRAQGLSDARLINVVASFVGSSAFSQGALAAVQEIDPALPEVLAVTNYFGYGTQGDIFALHAFGTNPGTWPADLFEKTRAIVRRNLYDTTASWAASAEVARAAGLPLVAYEGGQHLLPVGYGDWNIPAHVDFMNFMYAFQRSQQTKDLYLEQYALWNAMGGRTASLFVDTGGWSFWGYWGAKEFVTQTRLDSKKWDAFITWGDLEAGVRAPSEPIGSRPVLPELTLTGEAQLAASLDITATGGDGTVALELIGGELPPGLSFAQTASGRARIAGTPTQDGLYRIVVRALDGDGDPDYQAYTVAIDPQGVSSNALVVFRGQDIPGTIPNKQWITRFDPARAYTNVLDATSVLTRTYLPFSLADGSALFNREDLEVAGTPLVIPATSPLNMYGGWSLTALPYPAGTVPKPPTLGTFTGLRSHEWESWSGDSAGGPSGFDAVLLWRADQFNALGGSGAYAFGDDAATALLRVDLTALIADGDNELRFVVQDGGNLYLSEAAYTSPYLGDGYFQLAGFSGSSAASLRWALFTPSADAYAIPEASALSFSAKTFGNVQAVGFAYKGKRWGYNYSFNFARFLALGKRN